MANYKSLLLLPPEKAEKGAIERLERVLLAPGSEVAFEAHLVPENSTCLRQLNSRKRKLQVIYADKPILYLAADEGDTVLVLP